jgi:hypothetical protein
MSKLIGRSYTVVDCGLLEDTFNLMKVAHFIYGHQLAIHDVRDVRFYGYSEIRRGLEKLDIWMPCEQIKNTISFGSRFNFRIVGMTVGGLWLFSEDNRRVPNKDDLIIRPLDWRVYLGFLQLCKDNKIIERMKERNAAIERSRLICSAIIEKNTSGFTEEDFH